MTSVIHVTSRLRFTQNEPHLAQQLFTGECKISRYETRVPPVLSRTSDCLLEGCWLSEQTYCFCMQAWVKMFVGRTTYTVLGWLRWNIKSETKQNPNASFITFVFSDVINRSVHRFFVFNFIGGRYRKKNEEISNTVSYIRTWNSVYKF